MLFRRERGALRWFGARDKIAGSLVVFGPLVRPLVFGANAKFDRVNRQRNRTCNVLVSSLWITGVLGASVVPDEQTGRREGRKTLLSTFKLEGCSDGLGSAALQMELVVHGGTVRPKVYSAVERGRVLRNRHPEQFSGTNRT